MRHAEGRSVVSVRCPFVVESEVSKGRFSAGLTPWCDRIGLVRDAVRQELVKGQLARHLPLLRTHGRVLDVGCGQGT